jgi:hypothetical protein
VLKAGLADALLLHVVPVLLEDGTALFEHLGGPIRLENMKAGPVPVRDPSQIPRREAASSRPVSKGQAVRFQKSACPPNCGDERRSPRGA